ncbi:MAG: hypothetical protein ABIF77_21395 [bacterium]
MAKNILRFSGALLILLIGGLFLTAQAASEEEQTTTPAEVAATPVPATAVSPSQEVRAKLNHIRRNEFFYQSFGKTDPFRALVHGEFEQQAAAEIVDLSSAVLVGVIWGDDDRFAMVEDGEGFGYILRVGDPVRNGRVVNIRKTSLTAKITLYGITSTLVLKLENTEG